MTAPPLDRRQTVKQLLDGLRGLEPLKQLFWSELNYARVNEPLSRRGWSDTAASVLAEDPVLFASGGQDDDFHVIYARLESDQLRRGHERPVVARLLSEHPYALFIFSDHAQTHWHFLNVKYDTTQENRRLFRRITVGPEERLRTASDRIARLDLETISGDLFGLSPLAIQERHDEAFDVQAVTDEFFRRYREVFESVEGLIEGITEPERKRLFTQRLFNRLMFIAFIEKKGWLRLDGQTDYLAALWGAHQAEDGSDKNFYRDRLKLLFFTGLNNPGDRDIIGINRGGYLKTRIGEVPYLNGGLFEEEDDDRDPAISIPDACFDAILNKLFQPFNFTVTESTPLDVEVAVDPEMLGRVFDELVTGRHETGSYYTPKPVVSFMSREALKGYLATAVPGEESEAIEQFVEEHDPEGLRSPEAVLDALRRVRVCDPACGSGAYLLGMLHELLDLRTCLFATRNLDPITAYDRKLEIIQDNLYGVDLDPFAVNIARLRLWLSLAVEFEGERPEPLPNLDFKIEQGDSLTVPSPEGQQRIGRHALIPRYQEVKAAFMKAHLGPDKAALREQIVALKQEIADWTYGGAKIVGFDWSVEFAEVFADGGFNIVLTNPPYVRQELIRDIKPMLKQTYDSLYVGTADLYCYFYIRGLQLLCTGGMLAFISSNKWFRANYGRRLRQHVADTCLVQSITDFGELPVFNAATFPMIFIAQKDATTHDGTVFTQVKSLKPPYPDVLALVRERGQPLPPDSISGTNWTLTDAATAARLRKMEAAGIPLGEYVKGRIYFGIKTGFNTAFVVDGLQRAALVAADPKSAEIIRPLGVGDDVRKWRLEGRDRWLIVTPIGVNIRRYPAVYAHLQQWKPQLEKRWDKGKYWWELRPCVYYDAFDKPKIVFPDIAKEPRFALDVEGIYVNNTTYFISTDDLYLLGLLNSSLIWDYCKERLAVLGDANKGGRLRFFRQFVWKLPIPEASPSERTAIAAPVEKCLDAKGVGCEAWEREIDRRVAALYGL